MYERLMSATKQTPEDQYTLEPTGTSTYLQHCGTGAPFHLKSWLKSAYLFGRMQIVEQIK